MIFWKIAGARKFLFFNIKCVKKMGRIRFPKRRVRDNNFICRYIRSYSKYLRIIFLLAAIFYRANAKILRLKISCRYRQAQYLMKLEGDSGYSVYCQ